MKKSFIALSVLALVTILGAGSVFAGPDGHRGKGGPGMMGSKHHGFGPLGRLAMLKEKLDLSDQQTDQIKAIFAQVRDQNEPYRAQIRGGMGSIASTLVANPNDTAAAQALIDRQAAAERSMKSNMLAATSKALKVLTPEQRSKLGELLAERQARAEERRSKRSERRNNR